MTQEEYNKLSPREKFAERCTWHEGDIQIVPPKTELDFAYLAAGKAGFDLLAYEHDAERDAAVLQWYRQQIYTGKLQK